MGELGINITDLDNCDECGYSNAMIFQTEKDKWWVACGYRKCDHRTKEHAELLDAADAWGLKSTETELT